MALRYTHKSFVKKAQEIHCNKYDYSSVVWENTTTAHSKVVIMCPDHGQFEQYIKVHIRGHGCPACQNKERYTLSSFIEKSQDIHGNKYDYSLVEWTEDTNIRTKVAITCALHGQFTQSISGHINNKQGCASCANKERYTPTTFLKKATLIHGSKYEYPSVTDSTRIRSTTMLEILCSDHGPFTQTVNQHINGKHGCLVCGGSAKLTKSEFTQKAAIAHNNKYNYDSLDWMNYKNNKSKLSIVCPKHGVFKQSASDHMQRYGCPKCNSSRGELAIAAWLNSRNIEYNQEHKFSDCRNPSTNRQLRFDFHLPEFNTCIEFHGKQHYQVASFHQNTTEIEANINLTGIRYRDQLKTIYCSTHNIQLIIIPHTDIMSIGEILTTHLLSTITLC